MDISNLVQRWSKLDVGANEAKLNAQFTNSMWEFLGFEFDVAPGIDGGMQPDYVIFDQSSQPLLVVETKKRTPDLAQQSEQDFIEACKKHNLYKQAWGCGSFKKNNGIRQYLSIKNNPAKYGLVFNGDFFQLFRRVDGLIVPLTEIQKVTAETLPRQIRQLQYYLQNPDRAFVVSMWNRKGGVAKTTNTINIAAVLSAMGKRVLVVDFDPQVDLTKSLGINPEQVEGKILDCLDSLQKDEIQETKILLNDLIQVKEYSINNQIYPIYILPGEKETLEKFAEQEGDQGYQMTNKHTALKRLLSFVDQDYDYIFIDTSPKADMLTVCSLFAADGVIIPSDYDPETLRHASSISNTIVPKIRSERQHIASKSKKLPIDDIKPQVLGLVFSNCPDIGIQLTRQVEHYLNQFSVPIYETKLRHLQTIVIAKFHRKPVVFHRPNAQISKLYIKLTKEIFFNNSFVQI